MNTVYLFALGSNISFALGSLIFTHYSRAISPLFMNYFKNLISLFLFALTVTVFTGWEMPTNSSLWFILLSGFVGLGIGDIFLLKAFKDFGPGRTLILFGFQPLILMALSYIFLEQKTDLDKIGGIFFFLLCLVTFTAENYKIDGKFKLSAPFYAFMGMFLDAVGLLLTRHAFDSDPNLSPIEGNFYRCLAAMGVFVILRCIPGLKFHFIKDIKLQTSKQLGIKTVGALLGTYLSLGLYLKAIQVGNLASVSAMALTGTLFSGLFECMYEKKWPTKYLWLALLFFFIGMYLLLF